MGLYEKSHRLISVLYVLSQPALMLLVTGSQKGLVIKAMDSYLGDPGFHQDDPGKKFKSSLLWYLA